MLQNQNIFLSNHYFSYSMDNVFYETSLEAITNASTGIPRIINNIYDSISIIYNANGLNVLIVI